MQALWGLWLCQFCSKMSFVSVYQHHFDPILYARCLSWSLLWFLLEPDSRQVDVTKAKAQPSIIILECLLSCSLPYDSWTCSASFCTCFLWCWLGLAQWSGLAEVFLERCSILAGIWGWREQDPVCRSKAKCHSVPLGFHRAVLPSLYVPLW